MESMWTSINRVKKREEEEEEKGGFVCLCVDGWWAENEAEWGHGSEPGTAPCGRLYAALLRY